MESIGKNKHRVLLTGATGTLGRNLLDLIGNDPNYEICSLLRKESRSLIPYQSAVEKRLDLSDRLAVTRIVDEFNPHTVVHCAATGMEFPKTEWFDLIRFNVDFTINLSESAAQKGNTHFIFISTGLAYKPVDRPLNEEDALETLHPYGASKASADMLVRSAAVEFGLPLTVLRPFSFTGLGDDRTRLFPSILRSAANGIPMNLTPGTQVRDHLSARDVALAILAALENPPTQGEKPAIYNIGSGCTQPIRNVIEGVIRDLGIDVDLRFGVRQTGPYEPRFLVADYSNAKKKLGWEPRESLSEAVYKLATESFPTTINK